MIVRILVIIGIVIIAFFALTFLIYITNADMKMAAGLTKLMHRFYDQRDKKKKEQKQ